MITTEIYNGFCGYLQIILTVLEGNEDANNIIKEIMKHERKQMNRKWIKSLLK